MEPWRKDPCKAYSTVIGGFIYMIFLGSVYCTGVFQSYIASYFRIPSDKIYVQDLLPACLFVNMPFMFVGSYFVQRNTNPRLMILAGCTFAFTCMFIASFMAEG